MLYLCLCRLGFNKFTLRMRHTASKFGFRFSISLVTIDYGKVRYLANTGFITTSAIFIALLTGFLARTTSIFVETFDITTQSGTALGTKNPFKAGTEDFNSTNGDNTSCAVNGTGSGVNASTSFNIKLKWYS
jgi:hypothetical protein